MDAASLPARISYAVFALPVGGGAGFYAGIWLIPKLAVLLPKLGYGTPVSVGEDGFAMFKTALGIGAGAALTAALIALTLPWIRHRNRQGRPVRIAVSLGVVVVASLGFAGLGHQLIYDLAFAAWLAYTMTFTFVRYGVLDQARRGAAPAGDS